MPLQQKLKCSRALYFPIFKINFAFPENFFFNEKFLISGNVLVSFPPPNLELFSSALVKDRGREGQRLNTIRVKSQDYFNNKKESTLTKRKNAKL